MQLKWKVSEKSTGRYSSFHKRAFPMAYWKDSGRPAASLDCDLAYSGYLSKLEELPNGYLITIRVSVPSENSWKWAILKKRAKSVKEAKELAEDFFLRNPDMIIN